MDVKNDCKIYIGLEQFGKKISFPSVSQMLNQNKIVQLVPRMLPAKGDAKKIKRRI